MELYSQLTGGHSSSALCIETCPDGRLVSGGEDGELCLWSHDRPNDPIKITVSDDDVTSVVTSPQHVNLLYVSAGCKVFEYDRRALTTPSHIFNYNNDEIDQLCLDSQGEYLCASDDDGQVKVIKRADRKLHKTLRKHTNIVSSAVFRGSHRPAELFTGSLDCHVMLWDVHRARAVCDMDMRDFNKTSEDEAAPVESWFNPPMVLSVAASQHHLAVGCDNASVFICDVTRRNPEFKFALRGHTRGASQVHFLPQDEGHPDLLLSGGNDGQLLLWRLSSGEPGECVQNGLHGATGGDVTPSKTPVSRVQHGDKVNWVTSGVFGGVGVVAVADITDNLSLYRYQ